MELGIDSWKIIWELFISTAGVAVIGFAVRSYYITRRQHNFSVINNCVNKFQDNFAGLKEFDEKTTTKYLDLVNEELFYMQESYIPYVISVEWIDGILDNLPLIIDKKQLFTYPDTPIKKDLPEKLLNLYPRITNVFTITNNNDIELLTNSIRIDLTDKEYINLRKKILKELMINLFPNKKSKSIEKKTTKALNSFYSK